MNKNIFTPEDEQGIVDHMNDDHSSSLVHYCHLLGMSHITEKDKVVMNGIDQNGKKNRQKNNKNFGAQSDAEPHDNQWNKRDARCRVEAVYKRFKDKARYSVPS